MNLGDFSIPACSGNDPRGKVPARSARAQAATLASRISIQRQTLLTIFGAWLRTVLWMRGDDAFREAYNYPGGHPLPLLVIAPLCCYVLLCFILLLLSCFAVLRLALPCFVLPCLTLVCFADFYSFSVLLSRAPPWGCYLAPLCSASLCVVALLCPTLICFDLL